VYVWAVIAVAILSWLVAFDVINLSNRLVYTLVNFLTQITEPVLKPLRRILPQMGGLDLSPIVVILGIFFIRSLLREYNHF
jgi:YggT family protein